MKSTFLFSTRLRVYWVLLPIMLLLGVAIHYNTHSAAVFKLYPLIIFLCAAIIFVMLYFFRGIMITYDEIKHVGLFSERERVMIDEGKTIILDIKPHGRVDVTLFGDDGVLPGLDWMTPDEDVSRERTLFRARAIGGRFTVRSVLMAWGVEAIDAEKIISGEDITVDGELARVSTEMLEEALRVNIYVKKTV